MAKYQVKRYTPLKASVVEEQSAETLNEARRIAKQMMADGAFSVSIIGKSSSAPQLDVIKQSYYSAAYHYADEQRYWGETVEDQLVREMCE